MDMHVTLKLFFSTFLRLIQVNNYESWNFSLNKHSELSKNSLLNYNIHREKYTRHKYLHVLSTSEHSCISNTLIKQQASSAHLTVIHQLYCDSLWELTFTNCGGWLNSLGKTPVLMSDAGLEVHRACG